MADIAGCMGTSRGFVVAAAGRSTISPHFSIKVRSDDAHTTQMAKANPYFDELKRAPRRRCRAAARTVIAAAGPVGLLAVIGWTATVDPRDDEAQHASTLAPIMATRSTGSGRPLHAVQRVPKTQAGMPPPASLAR